LLQSKKLCNCFARHGVVINGDAFFRVPDSHPGTENPVRQILEFVKMSVFFVGLEDFYKIILPGLQLL